MDNDKLSTVIEFLNTAVTYMIARDLNEDEIDTVLSSVNMRLSAQGLHANVDILLQYKDSIMDIRKSIEEEVSQP